jgi:hypothetical protein
MNKVSGIALLILLVTGLGLNVSNIIDLIGSRGFLALIIFVVGALLIGFVLGGRDQGSGAAIDGWQPCRSGASHQCGRSKRIEQRLRLD